MSRPAQGDAPIAVGLGGNEGDVLGHFVAAHAALLDAGLRVSRVARAYRTRAWVPPGGPAQADHWNSVFLVEGATDPVALLALLHRIEAAAGRIRRERWAPRPLDLDLLLFGGLVRSEAPVLPHPGVTTRPFVLLPLADVAPDAVIPADGRSVRACLVALGDTAAEVREVRESWLPARH